MSMETIKIQCQEELKLVEDAKQLGDFWAKYLGKGGEVQKLMSGIKNVPNEEKKAYGQAVNEVKNWVQGLYDEKKVEIDNKALLARYDEEAIDVTLPATHTEAGNLHPLTAIKNEIIDVFAGMGFAALFKFIIDGLKAVPGEISLKVKGFAGEIGTQIYPAVMSVGYICGPRISS